VVTFAAGDRRLRAVGSRPLASVAIVQPAVFQADQWTAANRHRVVRQLSDLSLRAAADGPDLLVWPESALPGTMVEHPSWTAAVRELAMSIGAPIIFGAIDSAPAASGARWYNAAMLAEPGRLLGAQSPYYKAYLVPVIERTPFANVGAVFGVPYLGGYAPGGAAVPFALPFGRAGALICFESTFPMRSRQHRARGADVLVAISNDAWFGWSNAAHQHLAHLVLRAIETRTPVVRAANTGISAYIDPVGRIHAPTERFVPLARTYDVRTTSILTPFVRIGDAVGFLCLALTLAILAWPAPGRRQP
jgi:apolipoprotein N-acyltransferase